MIVVKRRTKYMNDQQKLSSLNEFKGIFKNYQVLNEKLASELKIASDHHGITGDYREETWFEFFRNLIPYKYSLAQNVKIIDSEKNVSKEVDIAVIDEQYTPYVFKYKNIKYIPIEAVAIAIQCKSLSFTDSTLKKWSESITNLIPKGIGVARIATGYAVGLTSPTQTRTRPIMILATTASRDNVDQFGETLQNHFDFILIQTKSDQEGVYKYQVKLNYEERTLGWWGERLNKNNHKNLANVGVHFQSINCKQPEGDKSSSKDSYDEEPISLQKGFKEMQEERLKDLQERCPELNFVLDEKLKIVSKATLAELKVHNNPLLTLTLQLNQLLMLINNPMYFPHFAYAKAFNTLEMD